MFIATISTSPAFAGDDTNSGVMCIQNGLVDIGINPGKPDGLAGPATRRALASYEKRIGAKLPILTSLSAAGICDVIKGEYVTFNVTVDGGRRTLPMKFVVQDEAEKVLAQANFKHKETILIGVETIKNAQSFCVVAPDGYGFAGPGHKLYQKTCDKVYDDMKFPGVVIDYEAYLGF